jgi:hypothetical protein
MSEAKPQSLKNHGKIDPPFHYVVLIVLVANLFVAIVHLAHHLNSNAAWLVVLSIAALILAFKVRLYALKVQDRVIRLEERLRLRSLAPADWHAQIDQLTEDQLIGLRFASDGEVVALAQQALGGNLNRKQIKENIKVWRADNWRV